jgi:hypothetical protein
LALILHHISAGQLWSYQDASEDRPGVLGRIRLSKRDATHLEYLIRRQSLPFDMFLRAKRLPRDEVRFFRAAGICLPHLLLQAMAASFLHPNLSGKLIPAFQSFVHNMLMSFLYRYRPRTLKPPPLTGDDLINHFGLQPSPRFKEILDLIEEERLAQDDFTPSDALEMVRIYLSRCR